MSCTGGCGGGSSFNAANRTNSKASPSPSNQVYRTTTVTGLEADAQQHAVRSDGHVAVLMLRQNGMLDSEYKFFEFIASVFAGTTRVEWIGDIALVPQDVAHVMTLSQFARYASIADVEAAARSVVAPVGPPAAQSSLPQTEKSPQKRKVKP